MQFVASFTLPTSTNQIMIIVLSVVYGVLAAGQLLRRRRDTARLPREGLITKFSELVATPR